MSDHIQVAALSDIGCVRTNNEDNFGYDPANDLYVVCDGMGGMAAGEVASSIACGTVIETYAAQPADTPVEIRLSLAIRAANDAVCHSGQQVDHKGMGTTLVAAVLDGTKLLIGNVGDSRAYMLKNGACMQLTVDHSYINELIRIGSIKVEDRHNVDLQGMESVITRAIGASRNVEPDFFAAELQHGDTILLASDGLTRYVDGQEIAALIDPAQLESSCQKLIDAAKAHGGADNVTCILLRYNVPAVEEIAPTASEATPSSFATTVEETEPVPVAAEAHHVATDYAPAATETAPPSFDSLLAEAEPAPAAEEPHRAPADTAPAEAESAAPSFDDLLAEIQPESAPAEAHHVPVEATPAATEPAAETPEETASTSIAGLS